VWVTAAVAGGVTVAGLSMAVVWFAGSGQSSGRGRAVLTVDGQEKVCLYRQGAGWCPVESAPFEVSDNWKIHVEPLPMQDPEKATWVMAGIDVVDVMTERETIHKSIPITLDNLPVTIDNPRPSTYRLVVRAPARVIVSR
jgi:hypothetical protein